MRERERVGEERERETGRERETSKSKTFSKKESFDNVLT